MTPTESAAPSPLEEDLRAWANVWGRDGESQMADTMRAAADHLATLTRQVEALTGERDTLVRVLDTTTETRDRYARALEEIAGAQPGGVTWTGAEAGLQEIARAALAGKEVGSDGGR